MIFLTKEERQKKRNVNNQNNSASYFRLLTQFCIIINIFIFLYFLVSTKKCQILALRMGSSIQLARS